MNKIMLSFALLFGFIGRIDAIVNFHEIYPPVIQMLDGTLLFSGDRHGEFVNDFVAVLSDGSFWKIHPTQRVQYQNWQDGDYIQVKVRTEFYFFKREHKFELYNHTKGEALKAMLVKHSDIPYSRIVVSTDVYVSGSTLQAVTETEYYWVGNELKSHKVTKFIAVPVYRKTLVLSDGSIWVIKDRFSDFTLGNKVYVGAQGDPKKWYDFVLISGTEREAVWTYARPPK